MRTFTYRSVLVGTAGMVVMAMWIHFHEVLVPNTNILAENSPPASAVGVFLGVILVAGLVTRLAPRLRLHRGELVLIYAMLVTSAPLMSQGMWHRFLGLVSAIPRAEHNFVLVDSFSEKLWPHGPHLVQDRRFESGLPDALTVDPPDAVTIVRTDASPVGAVSALEIRSDIAEDAAGEPVLTTMRLRVPRFRGDREILVPGERYRLTALFRLRDMAPRSRFEMLLLSDGDEEVVVTSSSRDTPEVHSAPGGFTRMGQCSMRMPRDVASYADIVVTLEGKGRVALTDLVFFSDEPIARLLKGTTQVAESELSSVPDNERDALVVRPDRLASPRGAWYTLKGYIPYRAWLRPMAYWTAIVAAVFACLLGISVIFRRQWADNERFTFPMVVLPRLLIEQKDEGGRMVRPLFRKKLFRVGFLVAVAICLLKGLAYYVPGLPDPTVKVALGDYFASPAMKAFWKGFYTNHFEIIWLFVAIAFFVDLEMLASILVFFFLAKIPFYLGEQFGWKNIKGPVDAFPFSQEQHIGSFLALAVMVLWVSRKHLRAVVRRILGDRGAVDDGREAFSYRTAAAMIVLSFVTFALWGGMSGVGVGSSLLFFGFMVICGLSASRIRTECGAPMTYFTPYYPYLIFTLLGGLGVFGTETMVLAYVVAGFMAVAQFLLFAPTQVEMLQLGEETGARPRGIAGGLTLGLLGGVLLGGYVMLVWGYGVGGENIRYMKVWGLHQDWYLRGLRGAVAAADSQALAVAERGVEATGQVLERGPVAAVGTGAGMTFLLTFLRARFVGFWLHPIGYILANTYFIYICWGSLLVAWLVKFLGLKIGGPSLIREQMTPFFAGIFCGCVAGMLLWDVVALAALSQGAHDVYTCLP